MNRTTECSETEALKAGPAKNDSEQQTLHRHLCSLNDSHMAILAALEHMNKLSDLIESANKDWEVTFDSIPDPVCIHEKDLRIKRANLAYIEAAAMPFEDIIGRLYYEVFPKMNGPFLSCAGELKLDKEETEEYRSQSTGKIYLVKFFPISDKAGNHSYSVHFF